MLPNLLNEAQSFITQDFISKASNYLEEDPIKVAKAFNGILPSVIGGIYDKTATGEGATKVIDLSKQQFAAANPVNVINSFGNDDTFLSNGIGLLNSIFDDKVSGLTCLI